eukprot:gene5838-2489_t
MTDANMTAIESGNRYNTALMFLKPHVADNEVVMEFVKNLLAEKGITVIKENGKLTGGDIASSKAIDLHYADIYAKAKKVHPKTLGTDSKMEDKFNTKYAARFGDKFDWQTLVNGNVAGHTVVNVGDYLQQKNIDEANAIDEFLPMWVAGADAGNLSKLAGGFYVVLVEDVADNYVWVVNGFWYDMKRAYVAPAEETKVNVLTVEWPEQGEVGTPDWAGFRDEVLGTTDPKDSPATTVRGHFYQLSLGDNPPVKDCNKGDNVCHASASPFEALRERLIWGATGELDNADNFVFDYESDILGKYWVQELGIKAEMLQVLD